MTGHYTMKKKELSDTVWAAKAIAILAVICAHTNFKGIENTVLHAFFNRIGSIGVPCFFVAAAYFFKPQKYACYADFIKKKLKTTVMPWLFCGTAVALFTIIRGGGQLSAIKVVGFVLGYESYLYYMTDLMILYSVFWIFKDSEKGKMLIVSLILWAVSHILTVLGVFDGIFKAVHITNYLNVLNWCFFFALGFYLQTKTEEEIIGFVKKYLWYAIFIWTALLILGIFIEPNSFGYFSILGPFMECAAIVAVFGIASKMYDVEFITDAGKYSFSIYLLHIQIIPIVYKFIGNSSIGTVFSPIATYCVTVLLLFICKIAAEKLHISKQVNTLLGMR